MNYDKILGVKLDRSMSWEQHIDTICSIIGSRLSLRRRIKPYLNSDSLYVFITLVLTTTLLVFLLPRVTASTISSFHNHTPNLKF